MHVSSSDVRIDVMQYVACLRFMYITEKVYRIMELDVVPVVLGFSNYSRILPPRSFIDVRDFESPKALATYLQLLDRNDSAYNEYFQWKEQYKCTHSALRVGCRLCEYALRERHRIQTRDVLSFWSKQSDCVSPDTFYGNSLNQTSLSQVPRVT